MLIEQIEWVDFPEDLKAIFFKHLERWWPMLPTWVQEVLIEYKPTLDATLQTELSYRARWMVLRVPGNFFDCSEEERANTIRHELIHANLEPMVSVCNRIIEDLTEDKSVRRELIDSIYTDGMEAAVEDMARSIGRLMERTDAER